MVSRMEHRTPRPLHFSAACAVIVAVAFLVGVLALSSALSYERVSEAVLSSLHSAFGNRVTVESVSVESFRRVALNGVRYAAAPGEALDVEIGRVLLDLHLPVKDLVRGKLTPARFVGRIELVEPVVVWDGRAGQSPVSGMDIEALIDLVASNPVLGELDCTVEASGGQLTLLSLPGESETVTLDQISMTASLEKGIRSSLDLAARWREDGSSKLRVTGHVSSDTRSYDMQVSASDIRLVDAVSTLYKQQPDLPAVHVLDGVADLSLSIKGGSATGDSNGPKLSAVLNTEGIEAVVEGITGSAPVTVSLGELSAAATISHEDGAVAARGTASVKSLSVGGVKTDTAVCDFEYAGGVLQLSDIGGSLMGGALGGQLSLSLTNEGIRGAGQGRLRGVMSSQIPIAGVSDVLDARLDGTVSLSFTQSDGLRLTGQLTTLVPRVAGLTFDDGTLRFEYRNGLWSVESLVLRLNGSEIVVKR